MAEKQKQQTLPLYFQIIIGIISGVVFSIIAARAGFASFVLDYIAPFGDIFINLLKLIAVPLVLFSIIKGISSLSDISKLGRLAYKTIGLYLLTTSMAVLIGLGLVLILKPGLLGDQAQLVENRIKYELWTQHTTGVEIKDGKSYLTDPKHAEAVKRVSDQMHDEGASAEEIAERNELLTKLDDAKKVKDRGPLSFLVDIFPQNIFFSLSNNKMLLQVIFFAVFFGICLHKIPKQKAASVSDFIDGANDIFLVMVDLIMKAAPYFVFALMAGQIIKIVGDEPGKIGEILYQLGTYMLVVVAGLLLMFVVYIVLLFVFVRKLSFVKFFKSLRRAQILAFSSSSSAATLPVTMECVEEMGVSRQMSSFVLPIGATVNMDGTSLYLSVAIVFLAQFHLVDLGMEQLFLLAFTVIMASVGTAAVPSASLVMMIVVLEALGLNPVWMALVIPVDRLLDMFRTVVNITGDASVATIVAATENELDYSKTVEQ